MDMGTAYARNVEMQTITDAGCRAGVYGGMNGNYTQYIVERYNSTLTMGANGYYEYTNAGVNGTDYHVYVMLDGGTALAVSRAIILLNIEELGIQTGDDLDDIRSGRLYVDQDSIRLCSPQVFEGNKTIRGVNTIPVWNKENKQYEPVYIESFQDYYEVLKSGNFFVTIEGEYKTIMASSVLGKDSIKLKSFAAAVATADLKDAN